MKFSIVIPIYQNESNIDDNIPRLLALKEKLPENNIELIFVDDGSTDSSYKMLIEQWKNHSTDIKVAKLCRNFGQTSAIRAGLSISTGDCVGIISADLQDPPELFLEMIKKWQNGHSVVIAERSEREENLVHQIFSRTYWRLVSKYALKNYPRDGFDFCLIDRKVVTAINKFTEKNTNIFAIIFWLGFSHAIIPYKRALRKKGKSQWTFRKKIRLLIDTFVGFSHLPIRTISYLGVGIFIATLFFILWALYSYIFLGMRYPGWTTLAILISGLGGLILLTLGLIGEYLWRILDESRNRPYYIIEEIKE